MSRRMFAACLLVTAVGPIGARPASAAGRSEALATAELFAELAREQLIQVDERKLDVRLARASLYAEAAVRLNPRLADALYLSYELAAATGDDPGAARALQQLLTVDPGHQGAFARLLELGLRNQQVIEKRVEWLTALLNSSRRSAEQKSMVHVELARLALRRKEPMQARMELDQALGADPNNPDAALLALEMLGAGAQPADALRTALRALRLNPFVADVAWRVGLTLESAGMASDAGTYFDYALALHEAGGAEREVSGMLRVQMAYNLLARNQTEAAFASARAALSDPEAASEAAMFVYWLLQKRNSTAEAEALKKQLADRFGPIREPGEWPVNEVAQAAWFHCTIDRIPQRALVLAEAAASVAPGDPFVRRVLGWAQIQNGRVDEGQKTLAPLVATDAYAAYQVARVQLDGGDRAAADATLAKLEHRPPAGPAAELLASLTPAGAATTRPAGARDARLAALLAEFDRGVLELYREPGRFLEIEVEPEDRSPAPGEPWWASFSVTNKSTFPISFGPGLSISPVFLLSYSVEGDVTRAFPNLANVTMERVRVLPPGATMRVRRVLDVGPVRRLARLAPQKLQRVSVTALFAPQAAADGGWQPGLGGLRLRPVYFNRVPARTEGAAFNALFRALNGDVSSARARALEVLAELLSERQRADRGRLGYTPDPVPTDRFRAALHAALKSESAEIRVQALEALQIVGLDRALALEAESCLEHESWVVRLSALRLLARGGRAFADAIASVAQRDPDDLVKRLAASIEAEIRDRQNATTAPSAPADDGD